MCSSCSVVFVGAEFENWVVQMGAEGEGTAHLDKV